MERQVFVSRERELTQLDVFLKKALNAQGLVCFVTGEAGSGKTALVTEFARRTQEKYGEITTAFGQCDAQTGIGDAYLPFREVLGQLMGDVDVKLAQGVINEDNANRLKQMLILSGQALVELGPDLVGIFVPGIGLATKVGAFAIEKVGWLDKLEQLVGKSKKSPSPGDSVIEQSHIFEQYTNVLVKLSEKHPLLLVLDDFQWADSASIGLLFHLARRIGGYRILIIGTYRPEEVAIGRVGERHPLEKVLAEIKRYFGDICVDLESAMEFDGWSFVNAFLDTEPNQFGDEFRHRLFQHTGGHPLFTIELLRNMQERGDLIQDEKNRYVETPELTWNSLPGRIEGVIEERIGRLEQELRQMLTVGCVEGENFTAEVVARVRDAEAHGIVRQLSGELERRHRLVRGQGLRQLDPTGQRLSLYKFQHNLFQRYLYNELDEAGRAYLHEDVGNALEALYGDQVDEIVVQLARHFEEAGISEKASMYLKRAGRQAAIRFANDEAIAYFSRALDLTPENNPHERFKLLVAREQIYGLQGARELQVKDLTALEEIIELMDDDQKRIKLTLRQARFAQNTGDYPTAITSSKKAIHLAKAYQDPISQAMAHFGLGDAARSLGDYKSAESHLNQAIALSQTLGLPKVEANSQRSLGILAQEQGHFDGAKTNYENALHISREVEDRTGESMTLNNLAIVFALQGDFTSAKSYFEQALPVFRNIGDRKREGITLGNLGNISAEGGDLRTAQVYFEQSKRISHEVGDRETESRMLGNLGVLSASLGDFNSSQFFFEQALLILREIGSLRRESFFLNELGYTLAMQGDYEAAFKCCKQSLQLARQLDNRPVEANALSKIGFIYDCLGNYASSLDRYQASLQISLSVGLPLQEGDVLVKLGLLYHHLGEDQTAREHCQRALEISREIDEPLVEASALTALGHALVGLDQLIEAVDAYRGGLTLRRDLGQPHKAMESLAGLARICLIQEDLSEAQALVEEILDDLESYSLNGIEEPIRVYLTCYRVLMANKNPRAEELLNTSYRLLQERAAKIDDEKMGRSYLENVLAHLEVVREFANTL